MYLVDKGAVNAKCGREMGIGDGRGGEGDCLWNRRVLRSTYRSRFATGSRDGSAHTFVIYRMPTWLVFISASLRYEISQMTIYLNDGASQ